MARKQTKKRTAQLKVEYVPISRLKPGRNPRKNDMSVMSIVRSIERFGYTNPIIVRRANNEIIAGETRWKALKAMGIQEAPVIRLTMSQIDADTYRIFDNKSTENTPWDEDQLAEIFAELQEADVDLSLTGFAEQDINEILKGTKEAGREPPPECEFATELLEEQQYIVLAFDNSVDWMRAVECFGIRKVKALDAKAGYARCGLGRVVDGKRFLARIDK